MKIPQTYTVVTNYDKDRDAENNNNTEIEPITEIKFTGEIDWCGTVQKFEWVSRLEENEE